VVSTHSSCRNAAPICNNAQSQGIDTETGHLVSLGCYCPNLFLDGRVPARATTAGGILFLDGSCDARSRPPKMRTEMIPPQRAWEPDAWTGGDQIRGTLWLSSIALWPLVIPIMLHNNHGTHGHRLLLATFPNDACTTYIPRNLDLWINHNSRNHILCLWNVKQITPFVSLKLSASESWKNPIFQYFSIFFLLFCRF
jgi:hypothetical protein